jgi:hypothetical protein
MPTPLELVEKAVASLDALERLIKRKTSNQIKTAQEKDNIKAVAITWFESFRPLLVQSIDGTLLTPLDNAYNQLLEFCDKSTSRRKYKEHVKTLKIEMTRLRSQITVLMSSGRILINQKPDFSRLINDANMLSIIDRRWEETINCLDRAPLEALLLARIDKEADKSKVVKARSAPRDSKTGRTKTIYEWTLDAYINVSFELGWITRPQKDIGVVLRDYRNFIHPREELKQAIRVEPDDARMYWAIFSTMAQQIVNCV